MKSKYKGIFFIILSAFFFALMALFIRIAGDIHFVQKAFFRNLIAFFFALAIMIIPIVEIIKLIQRVHAKKAIK